MVRNPKDTALRALGKAHDTLASATGRETASVQRARHFGVTWATIARALEQPERSVIRKYRPLFEAIRADVVREADDLELTPDEAVDLVRSAHRARVRAVDAEYRAVHVARDVAVTWQEIAAIVGLPHRAKAVEKYGRRPEPDGAVRKPSARLSPERRAELTRRVRGGESASVLAAEFGVSVSYARWLRTHDTVS